MGIGKRIKELRERAGLTQEELAQRVGVTASAVGNYEHDFSHPRESVLYKLFAALSCEPNELFVDQFDASNTPGQVHLRKYLELDAHGRELVDACTEIEYQRCAEGLTMVAARSFNKEAPPQPIRLKKRPGAGNILDLPDYKGD